MSNKDLKIKNLSRNRFRELKYICLQYDELKQKLKELSIENIKATIITGLPSGNSLSNPTQDNVVRKLEIERKVKAIEQAAIETDSELYSEIIKNVTNGISPRYLFINCSERKFYYLRRLFFSILDEKI